MTLADFIAADYRSLRPGTSPKTIQAYTETVCLLNRWRGEATDLCDLSEELVRQFLLHRFDQGRPPATVNRDRAHLLAVWECATEDGRLDRSPDRRRVKRYREPKRIPAAWSIDEMAMLLRACRQARILNGWDQRHWRALCLTIYDTSHRIGCLLMVERSQVAGDRLFIQAEQHKRKSGDSTHRLHPQTVESIAMLPNHRLLFPWPLSRRRIWIDFKQILKSAGLSHGPRDMFHRIRRTSYTYMYKTLGPKAAQEQAGHSTDLSRIYLDPTKLERQDAVDALPRPA